jgi:hypothetical protein
VRVYNDAHSVVNTQDIIEVIFVAVNCQLSNVAAIIEYMEVKNLTEYDFELGPIRPPSEAFSLLIRVTRNCPWNKCLFCPAYKGQQFELRPVEDVLQDIEKAKAIADWIKGLAWQAGHHDQVREVAGAVYQQYARIDAVRDVALWMFAGGKSAFLQDANSLIMKTPDLVRVVSFLKQTFPEINRITSYARSKTAAKKTVDELKALKEAGLTRLHIGLESGSDKVLEFMQKGTTAADHIKGGRNIMESGIELSEYIMPGLGGKKLSSEHVEGTAAVLNAINPHFIRIRTLRVNPDLMLYAKVVSGEFELPSDDELVMEIRSMIEKLEVTSQLKSDHMMNLLPEIDGKFPEAKEDCIKVIDRYLSLSPEERLNYRLGRRSGYYEGLRDLKNERKHNQVEKNIRDMRNSGQNINEVIDRLLQQF